MFDQAAEETAIRAWMKDYESAFNRHDVKAIVAQFDENWEGWDGTQTRATYEKSRTEIMKRQKDGQVKLLDEIGLVFVTPDIAGVLAAAARTEKEAKADPPLLTRPGSFASQLT